MTSDIRPGLCSVTFRGLAVDEIVRVAAEAGLSSIEWGTGESEHVPTGDLAAARRAGETTRAAGLAVASVGGYFRARDGEDVGPLLDAAEAMDAPRVRVWAGAAGSAETTDAERARVASVLRDAASRAADRGIQLALEFHGNTLTDTAPSAVALLEAVDHPNLTSYWQPTQGATDAQALAELDAIAPWITTLHVFSWWPMSERLRLAERSELWTAAIERAQSLPRVTDALIEFVPGDDPALLAEEAAVLRGWLA